MYWEGGSGLDLSALADGCLLHLACVSYGNGRRAAPDELHHPAQASRLGRQGPDDRGGGKKVIWGGGPAIPAEVGQAGIGPGGGGCVEEMV